MNEILEKKEKELLDKLNINEKRTRLRDLEAASMKEDFWKDSKKAADIMKKIADVKREIDDGETLELLISEGDEVEVERELKRLEFTLYLAGPYDSGDALFALHS